VAGLFGHFASLGRFIVHHKQREHADTAAQSALAQDAAKTLDLPRGLELEWLGVAGYRITFEGQTLFIDPYVSRVTLGDVLRRKPTLGDPLLIERWLQPKGDLVAVLVGHTHFDHAIDIPQLCALHDCRAYGSASLAHLMRLHGQGQRAVEVVPHRPLELGPFTVTFVPSLHSKLLLGYAVPSDGELTCEHLDALAPTAYKCGQVWGIHVEVAGTTFYHQGSANLLEEEIRHRGVDVFLAGIAGRRFTEEYWSRILGALQPRVVVASHFDDFFRPLGEPVGFSLNVNLAALPDEINAVSEDFSTLALQPFAPIGHERPGYSSDERRTQR
jgi:L-ascorbate metabolism protein UlaG (beta-lactamase superfamily)